ncbi:MAG TPA: hypothetical protein PK890_03515 [Terrimesophilobacter sp.]|nr:hypothetical protein [Terrimesophilobacter sp.]
MNHRTTTLVGAALIAALVLTGCSSPADLLEDQLDELTEQLDDSVDSVDDADETDAETEEAEEYDEVAMPSGFPAELPLPEGVLTHAIREGKNFVFTYYEVDAASVEAMVAWHTSAGWELVTDMEIPPVRGWTFGSPETNDYGHLQVVDFSFNADDKFLSYSLRTNDD